MNTDSHPKIRTTVLRAGRLSPAQKKALETLRPQFEFDPARCDSIQASFEVDQPLIMDIGFGNGESLLWAAEQRTDQNFIGVEVHPPGVGSTLRALDARQMGNVRLYQGDARDLLAKTIVSDSLAGVRLFFPDPWPKQRHHKRRIVQPDFVRLVTERLAPGGIFHLATDWSPYARQMLDRLENESSLKNCVAPYALSKRPEWRPETKFERRGNALGHVSHDLIYARISQIVS